VAKYPKIFAFSTAILWIYQDDFTAFACVEITVQKSNP